MNSTNYLWSFSYSINYIKDSKVSYRISKFIQVVVGLELTGWVLFLRSHLGRKSIIDEIPSV